ncbi:MAG: hypothetical protein WDZ40_02700 [Candidatus Spechtbacterales bacterium]
MPYKKRVIIFVSVMSVLAVVMSIFYVMQVRSNIKSIDAQDLKPEGFDEAREEFKKGDPKNILEFE